MANLKHWIPIGLKDFVKRGVTQCLGMFGWKLAPAESIVLDGQWYACPTDGLFLRHRPPALDDTLFQNGIDFLRSRQTLPEPDQASMKTIYYRVYIAAKLALAASELEGDFVEFGTYRGATAYAMLNATSQLDSLPKIYCYDTFSGIPSTGQTEKEQSVGFEGKYADTSLPLVRETLAQFADRVEFKPGTIPDTLDDSGPGKIAMMHVDLNLAEPTRHALHWAFPRWTRGGFCLLDDYLWCGFEDQRSHVEEFFASHQMTIIPLPTGQGLVVNPR